MWNDNMPNILNSSPRILLHRKRHGETLMEVMPPMKMHINEEKMVSQLNGMHLSNSYTPHGSSPSTTDSSFLDYILDCKSEEATKSMPSLKICEELKSQFNPSFKFNTPVPESIFNKFNTECTALVLWQPPIDGIGRTLSMPNGESSSSEKTDESDSEPIAPLPSPSDNQEIVDVDMMMDDDNNNSM